MGSKFAYIARPFIMPGNGAAAAGGLRLGFDIEANGLLNTATTVHCIGAADLNSDRMDEFGPGQIPAALERLSSADYLVGHNILNYDFRVLQKLYGWAPKAGCAIVDTLIASRLILPHVADLDDQAAAMGDPPLKKLRGRYSLEAWGARFGMPKIGAEIEDWSTFTPEMMARCIGDVAICKRLWQFLKPDGYSREAMALEHRVAPICDEIAAAGIAFDMDVAERLRAQWTARRADLEAQLQKQFPGTNLNSRAQIGALLEARGWVPESRTEKTKQPKIDDELLETLPAIYPEFAGLAEHYTLGRRLGQLCNGKKAWIKSVSADGLMHGGIVHIGTPHSRAKHLDPNLAQVPNPKRGKPLATECRSLFKARGDWVLVACDQTTLQDRGFAHYLAEFDGGAYARDFLGGMDTHWRTATALGLVDHARNKDSKVDTVIREGSKGFRYAFLYGAGVARAGLIIAGIVRAVRQIEPDSDLPKRLFAGESHPKEPALRKIGRQALDKFEAATPGLRQLRNKLQAHAQRHGWLPGLDGRRVPTRAQYSALNFIVTSSEAIICKRWLVRTYDELRARFRYGWDGDIVLALWIHDEIVACCRPEIAAEVGEIMVRNAIEPGGFYGFRVPLDAAFTVGRNWGGGGEVPAQAGNGAEPRSIDDDALAELLENEPLAPGPAPISAPIIARAAAEIGLFAAAEIMPVPPWIGADTPADMPVLRPGGNGHARDGFDAFAETDPGGKITCVFHDDHTPSLHIYPGGDDPHYHCFVCGAHGSLDELAEIVDWQAALKSADGRPDTGGGIDDARKLELAHEWWDKAKPITGTLAARYLTEVRGIDIASLPPGVDEVLRFHPRLPFGDKRLPCLVALFRDVETGERAGIHRIALSVDGEKLERRMLGSWPRPRAIKLWPADDKLFVGEGIETVLAAATRFGMRPAWALATTGYLEKLPLISGANTLTILVERDGAGEAAAAACARTWSDAGRNVRRLRTQDPNLNDFNDLVLAKLKESPSKIDWSSGWEEIKDSACADAIAAPAKPATTSEPEPEWPTLSPDAYYGLAGEVVTSLQPHTESDPVALLMHYLVYFGNCIGRVPYFQVESTRHFTNLFSVVAGATAKARKGTAAERIRRIFEQVDREWANERIRGGMSSGEGIMYAVRDPVYGTGKKSNDIIDPGIDDKRLLLDEREFYQALAVMKREGNIVSRVLRDAWDCREILESLTKQSPTRATDALISVIGHITIEELRETLDHTSIANGYSNRFLFACVRRSKLLSHGGAEIDLSPFATKTQEAVDAARCVDRVRWTDGTARMWDEEIYPKLSEDRPGMFGAITARAEAQTVRLAMIYALLDRSAHIRRRHLRAALAVWRYCDTSARFIFSADLLGDPIADAILRALQKAGELSRTDIRDLFGRHAPADKIEAALLKLLHTGKAHRDMRSPKGPGRAAEVWRAGGKNT
jgi:DNA polymerase I-like protein with 3'-5' exonuclease and polymerase domains